MGTTGAQGSAGPQGEKGPPGSHVQYVDSTGTEIPRFAYVALPGVGPGTGVVFDDDNLMWIVTVDPTTFAASAGAYTSPFFATFYAGPNCTGDVIVQYAGQPRNLPFKLSDSTNRLFPATPPQQITSESQNFIGQCQALTQTVTGYLASATVPATTINPPALSWSGPIEARWVE